MADDTSAKPADDVAATSQSHRRARASAELGQRFAELLAEPHASALGVCAKLRIGYATYKNWMRADADDPETAEEVRDFQHIVLDAHEARRVADIQAIEKELAALDGPKVATASALLNKHMFHHEKRFKRFYGADEEPKRAELDIGNKDGKPFAQHHTGPLTEQARRTIITEFLGVTAELLDAGAKAGDVDMSTPADDSDGGP